jgi:hypothetical protein
MTWKELSELDKDDLYRVVVLYSDYVQEYMEKNMAETGNQCVCIAEFYDNEYQDILQAEAEGLYDPKKDDWEFWEEFEDD